MNGNGNRFLRMELGYDSGSRNFLTGGTNPRGYFLSAQPWTQDGPFLRCVLGSGKRALIKEASRFSQKTLDDLSHGAWGRPEYEHLVSLFIEQEVDMETAQLLYQHGALGHDEYQSGVRNVEDGITIND